MYVVCDMRSAENSSYYNWLVTWSKEIFSHWTNNGILSFVVHWKMESSCL